MDIAEQTKLGVRGQMVLKTELKKFTFIGIPRDMWEAIATEREKMEQPENKKNFLAIKYIIVY